MTDVRRWVRESILEALTGCGCKGVDPQEFKAGLDPIRLAEFDAAVKGLIDDEWVRHKGDKLVLTDSGVVRLHRRS